MDELLISDTGSDSIKVCLCTCVCECVYLRLSEFFCSITRKFGANGGH